MTDLPTLLLIHGFPHDHTLWDPQVTALSDSAHVLAPDLRGFGTSGPVPEVMTMEAYAEDLKKLLDERGVPPSEPVVLCGLSMGGYVALAFLERWPERVKALVLCNTRSGADTEEGRAARQETARNAKEKGVPVIARAMLPKVLSEHTRTTDPELSASMEAMMARQRPEAVAAAALGMARRPDRTALLSTITVPTLIITGAEDELMPLPTSEAMHQAIAQSELVVIPNVAHLSNVEDPVRFNATLRNFLSSLPHA